MTCDIKQYSCGEALKLNQLDLFKHYTVDQFNVTIQKPTVMLTQSSNQYATIIYVSQVLQTSPLIGPGPKASYFKQ